jgi:membrane-associated PAP2 superfamily phosphatase
MLGTYKGWVVCLSIAIGFGGFNSASAQIQGSDLPDAPSEVAFHPHHGGDPASDRKVSWGSLPKDFLHDQKQIWTFPVQLAKGKYWVPTAAIVGVTGVLIATDKYTAPYFRNHQGQLDDVNDGFNSYLTTAEVIAVPAGLLIAGYERNDDYQVQTAILAGEAYADSAIVDLAIKAVSRRKRPIDVPVNGSFNDTFFAGGQSPFKGSSFPSGHAAGVFSVATVVAERYRNHRWVPVLAYGFAAAISFSRITTSAHYASDVFLGGALGYTITKYAVLQPRSN